MTGSVAIDIVIGLVFVYLLYSLFATVIMEIINSFLGLRARNLRYTIRRMLMDEKTQYWTESSSNKKAHYKLGNAAYKTTTKLVNNAIKFSGWSFNLDDPGLFHKFYDRPSIKYLSAGGIANKPSYISSQNFSKALIDTLIVKYNATDFISKVVENLNLISLFNLLEDTSYLKNSFETWNATNNGTFQDYYNEKNELGRLEILSELLPNTNVHKKEVRAYFDHFKQSQSLIQKIKAGISVLPENSDTRIHLESLVQDANTDMQKFKFLLEQWFDDTMERSTGWFKRRVQYILIFIGFGIAVFFNANTLDIVKKLANDTDARAQMVELAIAYNQQNNPQDRSGEELKDSLKNDKSKTRDSLISTAKNLSKDIYNAQNVIGTNWNIPNHLKIIKSDKAIHKDSICFEYDLEIVSDKNKKCQEVIDTVMVYLEAPKSLNLKFLKESISTATETEFKNKQVPVNNNTYKFCHIFTFRGFWGYLLTALAISLGSPFWFDLLNKLIKLRNSIKPKQQQPITGVLKPKEDINVTHRVG